MNFCDFNGDVCLFYVGLMLYLVTVVGGQSYQDSFRLEQDMLTNYSTIIRPLLNQSDVMPIAPLFELVAVLGVDEVQQKLVVNGFLGMAWVDQLLTWNPDDYNGINRFSPEPEMIWKPRMILLNTMDERDMFEDDFAPVSVDHTGLTTWSPGGLFPALCSLNLQSFPFDAHKCELRLSPMFMNASDMVFDMTYAVVTKAFFIENGEWALDSTVMTTAPLISTATAFNMHVLKIEFGISRKPMFFLINILFPVVFLCALNVVTFAIPEVAGEKIGFSINVLLAMSVYMGIISENLPTNSEKMPYVTIYIFFMFGLAVCSCVVTIIIVWFHHKEEETEKKQKREVKIKGILPKLSALTKLKGHDDIANVRPESSVSSRSSANINQVEVTESSDGELLRNPESDNRNKSETAVAGKGKKALTRFPKVKAGITPWWTPHDLNGTKSEHHARSVIVNRYKKVAYRLNFYSGVGFGTTSLVATLFMIILITS